MVHLLLACVWNSNFIKILIFYFLWNFQWPKLLKTQYLLHLMFKSNEINSIEALLMEGFQKISKSCLASLKGFSLILLRFHWENNSIFNYSCIISLNIMEPPQCTPMHWALYNGDIMISMWQNKIKRNKQTNDLPIGCIFMN